MHWKNIFIHVQQNTLSARNIKDMCRSVKSIRRVVPHKRCSPPNSGWLGNFEKILSSIEIWTVWGTHFKTISLFSWQVVGIIISKVIKRACICIINYNLQYVMVNLVKLNILLICKRCSFSIPSWLEKKEKLSGWIGKSEHLFTNLKCSKPWICFCS